MRVAFACDRCGIEYGEIPDDAPPGPALARCETCGFLCEERGARVRQAVALESGDAPMIACDFKPRWLENLGHEPVYVSSRREYHEHLRRRGLRNEWTSAGAERGDWTREGHDMVRPGTKRGAERAPFPRPS